MKIKVALISNKEAAGKAYMEAAGRLAGITVDHVSSFSALENLLHETPYNGVMIDLPTKLKARKSERRIAESISGKFPVAQLGWESKTGTIRALYGRSKGTGTIEDFINRQCRSFRARTIRAHRRKRIHLNVILSRTADFPPHAVERTVTMNISGNGCFVFSGENWEGCRHAWIIIKELSRHTPIKGDIQHHIPWGRSLQFPGIGLKFAGIGREQEIEIHRFINASK